MKHQSFLSIGNIIKHTLLLGVVASISHFAYDISNQNAIVGLFNPINESIWEHLKIMFFPQLVWWIVMYRRKSKSHPATTNKKTFCITNNTWIVSAAVSLVIAPLMVVFLYYSYTEALGIHSEIVNILLVFICYFVALSVASHVLKYAQPKAWVTMIALLVIITLFVLFIVFTIKAPWLPIFQDA